MNFEKDNVSQPEFEHSSLQWAKVKCRNSDCAEEFICTPYSDYYGSNGITNDDGVFIDGQCEPCMLTEAGMKHLEHPVQLSDNAGVIGTSQDTPNLR